MAVTFMKRNPDRTVVTTFRFDERTYFGLELLARRQHRSLNLQVEFAVARLLQDPVHGLGVSDSGGAEQRNILDEVWDPDEADRIVILAMKYPTLLGPWARVWKAISEDESLWTDKGTPVRRLIRRKWETLKQENQTQSRKRRRK